MFLTITIDTSQKKKSSVMMKKRKIAPCDGWRKALNKKRRNLWLRVVRARKTFKNGNYRLDGQRAMF